jgi:HAD superfamily hydrolase (TIGR01484 family)
MKYPIIFSDFDGTLTDNSGHLGPGFLEVVNLVQQKKRELVIVSGRSVTWGYFFLTHFPLQACLMEGGGVIVTKDENGIIRDEVLASDEDVMKLNEVTLKLIQTELCQYLSADSYGRKTDQALEIYQMPEKLQKMARDLLAESQLSYSQSNVHLNFWAGEISKYQAVLSFLERHRTGVNVQDCLYFGDALNDQSMFQYLQNSVGVSNIESVLDQMDYPPKTILKGEENAYDRGVFNYLESAL